MLRATLANLLAHRRRLVGTLIGIVAGVAFLAGTLVLGDTLRASFDDLFADVNAGTDAVVRMQEPAGGEPGRASPPFAETTGKELAEVPGVASVAPAVQGYGRLLGRHGEPIGGGGPPTLAGAWITDPHLNPYRLVDGRAPERDDEVVVNQAAADEGDLRVGDGTTVLMPGPVQVRVVGIATIGGQGGLGATTWTAFSLPAAQRHILGGPGLVSAFRVRAEPSEAPSELVERIDLALPPGLEVLSGTAVSDENTQEIEDEFLGLFTNLLVAFAALGMVVATFGIHNTFSILVAQRTREWALLRAVGASRTQVFGSAVVEALAFGLVGSVIGAATGLAVAAGLLELFRAFGFPLPGDGLTVEPGSMVLAAGMGMVATGLAVLAPAVRASHVAPLAALRGAAVESVHPPRSRAALGGALAIGGSAAVVVGGGWFGAGAVAVVVGAIVLAPVLARPVAQALGAPLPRMRGITGTLARANAVRNPRRTAGAAGALVVGVGVLCCVMVMLASVSESTRDAYERSFGGDLAITAGGFQDAGSGGFSTSLAGELAVLPEVDHALALGIGELMVDGDRKEATIADPAGAAAVLDLGSEESLGELGDDGLAVSDQTAEANDWVVGDRLAATYPDGATEELTLRAVYAEGGPVEGLLFPRAAWAPHTAQDTAGTILVDLAPGVSAADGRPAVAAVARRYGATEVQDRQQYVDQQAAGFTRALGIVYVLLALSVLIALLGIANTLSLSVHERARELGLLRAVGQTAGSLRSMLRWEAGIVSVLGTLGGIALGLFIAWGLVRNLGPDANIERLVVPAGQLGIIVALGGAAGLLAGARPARRASRMHLLDALAAE